jgi:TolB protein
MRTIAKTCLFLLAMLCSLSTSASDEKLGVTADSPSVSPATNEIIFSADLDGPTRLWVIGADGLGLRKISKTWQTQTSIYEMEPAWSPNGKHLAYVSMVDGGADIWVMQADGAYPTQLTRNGANNTRPAWSPDGTKIAFVSDKDGTKDIWLMNADGSGLTKIVGLPGEENRPSYSPAGDRIVFSESDKGVSKLMIVSATGGHPQTLTTGNFRDWDPHWGPSGIVFSSDRDGSGRWKIWTIQQDGSGLHKVGDFAGLSPVWMRDGRIAFTEEIAQSRAVASISMLNPTNDTKQALVDIQGYPVSIDIRPGSNQNNVNPKSHGNMEIAILSTKDFDAFKNVIQSSITFGHKGSEISLNSCSKASKDVNGDGIPDLVCRFNIELARFSVDDAKGVLRFLSQDGRPFAGSDTIRVVPYDDPSDFK